MKRGFLTTAKAKRQLSALNPEHAEKPTTKKSTSLPAGSVNDLKDLKIVEGMSCMSLYAQCITEDVLQFPTKSFWTVCWKVKVSRKVLLSLIPPLNVAEANKSLTEEVKKGAAQMMDMMGYTDDDFKKGKLGACVMCVISTLTDSTLAFVSAPDENDPGAFVNTPHEDDDLSRHVQVPFPGGWTQCLISGYLDRRLKHISGFPRPIKETKDKAYRISSSPGKGLGMFATRKIKMGDLIVDERPLMVVSLSPAGLPGVPMKEGLTQEEKYQYILNHSENVMHSVFGRMSEESKNVFMDLRNSHLHDGSGPILGVVRTNGYGLGDDLKDKTSRLSALLRMIVSHASYSTIEETEKLLESTPDDGTFVCDSYVPS